jgi:proteasome component ECM29
VTANSELFPEGFLGTTPSGNAITSYKDICSMADDLNQPEYVLGRIALLMLLYLIR